MTDLTPLFQPFRKIARLSRDIIITEKIDGSNAQLLIPDDPDLPILAGSRTRWLEPGKLTDNYGFAAWVKDMEPMFRQLPPGRHYGEWFGNGIQRGYGLGHKRLIFFNPELEAYGFDTVPILYTGAFDTWQINSVLERLKSFGSIAVPGFMDPEGIVVFHAASGQMFKKTLVGDEKPKGAEK